MSMTDIITLTKDEYEELFRAAYADALTGTGNRRLFEKETNDGRHVDRVFLLDFDKFKLVNDNHGHAEGDRVLKDFVNLFLVWFGQIDKGVSIYRLGGDEFVITTKTPGASERVSHWLMEYRDYIHGTTVSFGVATVAFDEPGRYDLSKALKTADEALYTVKAARKDDRRDNR